LDRSADRLCRTTGYVTLQVPGEAGTGGKKETHPKIKKKHPHTQQTKSTPPKTHQQTTRQTKHPNTHNNNKTPPPTVEVTDIRRRLASE